MMDDFDRETIRGFHDMMQRRQEYGLRGDGHYCLACGEPLFGPEFLHASSLTERPSNLLDAIRYAGVGGHA